jgi:hypothetical protein
MSAVIRLKKPNIIQRIKSFFKNPYVGKKIIFDGKLKIITETYRDSEYKKHLEYTENLICNVFGIDKNLMNEKTKAMTFKRIKKGWESEPERDSIYKILPEN